MNDQGERIQKWLGGRTVIHSDLVPILHGIVIELRGEFKRVVRTTNVAPLRQALAEYTNLILTYHNLRPVVKSEGQHVGILQVLDVVRDIEHANKRFEF